MKGQHGQFAFKNAAIPYANKVYLHRVLRSGSTAMVIML